MTCPQPSLLHRRVYGIRGVAWCTTKIAHVRIYVFAPVNTGPNNEAVGAEQLVKKRIEIRSLGVFYTKIIKEKKNARNPKTGEKIYVPEKVKLRFKASKELKKFINTK